MSRLFGMYCLVSSDYNVGKFIVWINRKVNFVLKYVYFTNEKIVRANSYVDYKCNGINHK